MGDGGPRQTPLYLIPVHFDGQLVTPEIELHFHHTCMYIEGKRKETHRSTEMHTQKKHITSYDTPTHSPALGLFQHNSPQDSALFIELPTSPPLPPQVAMRKGFQAK